MSTNGVLPRNNQLLIAGAGLLVFAMAIPLIFLLAKIAIGLIMISIATIAVKIALKTISSALKQNDNQNLITQNRAINIAVGLVSIFAGGLSLLMIAKTGLIAAYTAVAGLVLYEYLKNEEIGQNINNKFNEAADNITDFTVSSIEKLISSQIRPAPQP